MGLKEECQEKAIEVLEKCVTPHGFYAANPGYDMVFGRDSMIMSLGASLIGDKFKKVFAASLATLGVVQSARGQIPNAVDSWSTRKPHVDYKSIDSTLWWIIGQHRYKEEYGDPSIFQKNKKKIEKALNWVSYQDAGEDGMPEQLPTTDWQDAFPHRYGHTINTQALYHGVLRLERKKKEAEFLKKQVNTNKEDSLWNGEYYLSWRWKNHNGYREMSDWFDTLGNMLAIVYDLADVKQTKSILDYIEKNKINRPYPLHASVWPPIESRSKQWQDYYLDSQAGKPWHYLNSGIWTYVGGFYVCALVKAGRLTEAEHELGMLAEANMKSNFAEWLDGRSGETLEAAKEGGVQGWNAGMYIAAYLSVMKKKCLI